MYSFTLEKLFEFPYWLGFCPSSCLFQSQSCSCAPGSDNNSHLKYPESVYATAAFAVWRPPKQTGCISGASPTECSKWKMIVRRPPQPASHLGPISFRGEPFGIMIALNTWLFILTIYHFMLYFLTAPCPTHDALCSLVATFSIFQPKEKWCVYCWRVSGAPSPDGDAAIAGVHTHALIWMERNQLQGRFHVLLVSGFK